jgi:hypothetical protein
MEPRTRTLIKMCFVVLCDCYWKSNYCIIIRNLFLLPISFAVKWAFNCPGSASTQINALIWSAVSLSYDLPHIVTWSILVHSCVSISKYSLVGDNFLFWALTNVQENEIAFAKQILSTYVMEKFERFLIFVIVAIFVIGLCITLGSLRPEQLSIDYFLKWQIVPYRSRIFCFVITSSPVQYRVCKCHISLIKSTPMQKSKCKKELK